MQVLKVSYSKEYEMLEILAVQGNETFIDKVGGMNVSTIQHLIGYGVLKKYKDTYFITIEALRLYFVDNSNLLINDTTEEKRTAISKRRNKLEIKLRYMIYNVFISKYGRKYAREKVLKAKKLKKEKN